MRDYLSGRLQFTIHHSEPKAPYGQFRAESPLRAIIDRGLFFDQVPLDDESLDIPAFLITPVVTGD